MPARNAQATIGEQLNALGRQRFDRPWELLVLDHGSTDATAAVVGAWRSDVPRRVVAVDPAKRIGAVRNEGVALARSEVVAFCDADDVVDDDWLAELVRALDHTDVVTGARDLRRLNGPESYGYPSGPAVGNPMHTSVSTSNMATTRTAIARVGGFDEGLPSGEDVDLEFRARAAGLRVTYEPRALVHRRLRRGMRALFRQHYWYGTGQVVLHSRHRQRGKRRHPPLNTFPHDLGFLVLRSYWLFSRAKRGHLAVVAGRRTGRLVASIRYRVFHP